MAGATHPMSLPSLLLPQPPQQPHGPHTPLSHPPMDHPLYQVAPLHAPSPAVSQPAPAISTWLVGMQDTGANILTPVPLKTTCPASLHEVGPPPSQQLTVSLQKSIAKKSACGHKAFPIADLD